MDLNNISGSELTAIDDALLEESDISAVSSIGVDLKQMAKKIQQLEAELAKKNENQYSGPSMIEIGWQICKKFDELKKEMAKEVDVMKLTNQMEMSAFEELTKEVEKIGKENSELKANIDGKNAEMDKKFYEKNRQMKEEFAKLKEELAEKERKINELEKGMAEMKEEMRGMKANGGKIEEVKNEIGKLCIVNGKLKEQIVVKNGEFKRKLDWLEEENAKLVRELRQTKEQKADKEELVNLAERIAVLEAPIKMDLNQMKENKLYVKHRGPKLMISEGGLEVKFSGTNAWNCVRAKMAIPKFNSNSKIKIAYFEVEFLAKRPISNSISIGFCTEQFPLEGKWLGILQNSIGIGYKGGILMGGSESKFGNDSGYFKANDVVGIGIVHFPANSAMKCFASYNGQLLGKIEMPIQFADLHLFPAISMFFDSDSFRANFGADQWRYIPCEEHLE